MCPTGINLVYLLFFIINLFDQGESLMCYNCSSSENINCGKYFDGLSINQMECNSNEGCVKVKHPAVGSGLEPVSRGCYNETACGPNEVCIVCKRDLCNSSVNTLPSLMAVFLLCTLTLYAKL